MLIPSKSPWASPILIVKKKDGSNRVVIDYRRLNKIMKKDSYPLPRIDDALDRLRGAKYFSAMDLISGYWQIDLPPEEQEKCAIISSEGLYQPTRMPQGLCNAPATFQRAMDNILSNLKLSCVLVYLDDINVFSCTFTEHLHHLEQVFIRLQNANLKIKPRKCHFFKDQLEYLGFVIDKKGLRPQPAKIEALERMQVPTNKRDIQVFLGMVGYYRRFIPDFAKIGEPLFHLLKAGVEFNFSDACVSAFNKLTSILASAPVLMYPDFDKPFVVQTDASLNAVGAVLSQLDDKGLEHPVAYASRTLNTHERNYTVTERECLAVIYAYKQFRTYLHGVKFQVVTDHASLTWLQNLKEPEGRLARWALKLQAYDYEIIHRPGTKHQNADCLSRLPTIATLHRIADQLYLKMRSGQYDDEPDEVQKILEKHMKDTVIEKNQLYKIINNKKHIFPIPSERVPLITAAHRAIGHGGFKKTLAQLQQNFYWESMSFDVQDTLQCCAECQAQKPFKQDTSFKLVESKFAWHTISIDVIGPLPPSHKYKYIIVAIDQLTKWVEARAIRDVSASTTAKFVLEAVILQHGCPQFILSNNGTNFTSQMFARLNELMGVRNVFSTPYHPETNGIVERVNGTLTNILRKLTSQQPSAWSMFVPAAVFAYNISVHSATKFTPFQLLYGHQAAIPPVLYSTLENPADCTHEQYAARLADTLIKLQSMAFANTMNSKIKALSQAGARRRHITNFTVGDMVAFCNTHGLGRSNKLSAIWIGPFEVIEKTSSDAYSIKDVKSGSIINRVHAKFLRKFFQEEGGLVDATTSTDNQPKKITGLH